MTDVCGYTFEAMAAIGNALNALNALTDEREASVAGMRRSSKLADSTSLLQGQCPLLRGKLAAYAFLNGSDDLVFVSHGTDDNTGKCAHTPTEKFHSMKLFRPTF
jgi:hypothetical protein